MKKLLLLSLAAILFAACETRTSEPENPIIVTPDLLLGVWHVDSLTALGAPVNQTVTFEKEEFSYFVGPDGDEMWGGETFDFIYELENNKMTITSNPLFVIEELNNVFSYTSNVSLKDSSYLVIDHFSSDGVRFYTLNLKRN